MDPVRWKEEGSDAPEALRRLVASAPRSKVLSAVEQQALGAAAVKIAALPVAKTGLAALVGSKAIAAFAVGALVTAAVAVPVVRRSREASTVGSQNRVPSQATRSAPAPVGVAAAPAPVPVPQEIAPPRAQPDVAPIAPRATTATARPAARPAPGDEEAALDALSRTVREDPQAALRALHQFDRTFPRPEHDDMRDFLEIDALRRSGRENDALLHARRFLQQRPSNLFGVRIRRMFGASLD